MRVAGSGKWAVGRVQQVVGRKQVEKIHAKMILYSIHCALHSIPEAQYSISNNINAPDTLDTFGATNCIIYHMLYTMRAILYIMYCIV